MNAPAREGSTARRAAALVLLVVLAVALCQRFVLTVCVVSGASMTPGLVPGARVLVLRLDTTLERGDLVVLKDPDAPDELLVKRVLGLPGEHLALRGARLALGDLVLPEPWLPAGTTTEGLAPTVVPPGHLLVLGDNRGESVDSRRFGPVDRGLVVGKVVARVWTP